MYHHIVLSPSILVPGPFIDEKPKYNIKVTGQVSQEVESEAK